MGVISKLLPEQPKSIPKPISEALKKNFLLRKCSLLRDSINGKASQIIISSYLILDVIFSYMSQNTVKLNTNCYSKYFGQFRVGDKIIQIRISNIITSINVSESAIVLKLISIIYRS